MGNTETVPPDAGYPLGRHLRGSAAGGAPDASFTRMLKAQGAQPPVCRGLDERALEPRAVSASELRRRVAGALREGRSSRGVAKRLRCPVQRPGAKGGSHVRTGARDVWCCARGGVDAAPRH
jgi:hypothetical protein